MTVSVQPNALAAPHRPLSQRLTQLLEQGSQPEGMSLNAILNRTEGRGIYLVIVFACLPFVVPVSLPGFSSIMGFIVAALSFRLALRKPPALPGFLGRKVLQPKTVRRILNASVRVLRVLEKVVRPRGAKWLNAPIALFAHGVLMIFMAFLMALPVPPVVPLTNSLPSYAIILIAVSIMEEDGATIWLGYAAALGTLIYFVFLGGYIIPEVVQWLGRLFGEAGGGA